MDARRRAAIIVAGGTGERFGRVGGKQLALVAGRPALSWSLMAIAASEQVAVIVLVCTPGRIQEYREQAVDSIPDMHVPIVLTEGGDTRRLSVAAGLDALPADIETVIVHDGARPLATAELFSAVTCALEESDAQGVIAGHPSIDTLKVVDGSTVVETPERSRFWAVQTPQVFQREALDKAHRQAEAEGFEGTDDAALVEHSGGRVLVYEGPRDNIKLTVSEDLLFAEAVLLQRFEGSHPC